MKLSYTPNLKFVISRIWNYLKLTKIWFYFYQVRDKLIKAFWKYEFPKTNFLLGLDILSDWTKYLLRRKDSLCDFFKGLSILNSVHIMKKLYL